MTRPALTGPLAIVMPVLDEAATLPELLATLQPLRRRGVQVVVADGGSTDGTPDIARSGADLVLAAPRGRAVQMNAGAAACATQALLFLHADTRLPGNADLLIARALQGGALWGRFDVQLDSPRPVLRIVGWAMNGRSRLTGIATGDQAVFVRREVFDAVGGFPAQPLMEDIALSSRLKRQGAPACLRQTVRTSARRWERHGVWRTIVLMWRLRAAYWLGVDPARLAVMYGYKSPPG